MENGFSLELYDTIFENCFTSLSRYSNGNLKLSLFEFFPETNETEYITDITLNQNRKILNDNEIVVDFIGKTNFISQLKELGILKEQVGVCAIDSTLYPIYTIDVTREIEEQYCMQLVAA